MNTAAKGRRNESKTARYLRDRGYLVITTVRSSYKGSNDFFNLFDHIAVHILSGTVLFVQTKSNRIPPPAYRKLIEEFPAQHKQLFIWYDRVPEPRIIDL